MESNKEVFFKMLSEVKPINLFSQKTTKKEALAFYAGIMKAFAKYSGHELQLSSEDNKRLSHILLKKGCITLDDYKELKAARPDYFSSGKNTMGDLIKEPNDLGFPISAAGNAIYSPEFTTNFCFGKDDWCDVWIKTYQKSLEENETF